MIQNDEKPKSNNQETRNRNEITASSIGLTEAAPSNPTTSTDHQKRKRHKTSCLVRLWRIHRRGQKVVPRSTSAEKVTVFITAIIALCTATQALIYWQQKKIMQSGGQQTDKLISAANIQAGSAQKIADASNRNAAAAEKFAASAETQASANRTQAEASLRSAKAQETANGIVSRQFEIMQSSELDLKVFQSSTGPTWRFSNIGKEDMLNLVIRRDLKNFSSRTEMYAQHFDPIRYLNDFRLDPGRPTREFLNGFAKMDAQTQYEVQQDVSPRALTQRIHQGEGVQFEDSLGQGAFMMTYEFFLADWDDRFGHHSEQFCEVVDGSPPNARIYACGQPMQADQRYYSSK